MGVYAVLLNSSGGELDRARVSDAFEPDSAEMSEAIHDAIDDWMLAAGDTIKIVEIDVDQVARELLAEALKIASQESEFRDTDWDGFGRVMWPDDSDRKERGMDRDDYEEALRRAWNHFEHERGTA